jgi:hypothetical protein
LRSTTSRITQSARVVVEGLASRERLDSADRFDDMVEPVDERRAGH